MRVVKKDVNPFLMALVLMVLMPLDFLYNQVKSCLKTNGVLR